MVILQTVMVKGAVHPNGSNFSRVLHHDIVSRMRSLVGQGCYKKRPEWLVWCERVPPLELHNIHWQDCQFSSTDPIVFSLPCRIFTTTSQRHAHMNYSHTSGINPVLGDSQHGRVTASLARIKSLHFACARRYENGETRPSRSNKWIP